MWKETPIPMYLDFHMFNWTNAHLVEKDKTVKPAFVEMGPYIFYEHHIRANVVFHDNDTLTYLNKRIWRFEPEKSNGSLDDIITILNPMVALIINTVKDEHVLVKEAVDFFLEEKGETLAIKKTIRELIFDGYDDALIDIAEKLNISGINIPFKKFGWFVERNNSATYDGVFNMYSGGKDISKLGVITRWNYEHKTSYYPGDCGIVNGTSGELWYPPRNSEEISIFTSDLCSNVKLHKNGTSTIYGIEGTRYVGSDDAFDNGTYYENSKCFSSGVPTGVRSVSTCKFNAPAYISFPHFYHADPIYRDAIDGMNPDPLNHTCKITLEPSTGFPLEVFAAFQLNLLLLHQDKMRIVKNVNTTMIPCFWFAQRAEMTEDLASEAKTLLTVRQAVPITGYGLIGLGGLLLIIFGVITYRTGWKSMEEESLISSRTE
ncbi:hypothetical protein ABEB36_004434 [Hypothenemus hampei]